MIAKGTILDVGPYPRTKDGDYILDEEAVKNYRNFIDMAKGIWIRTIVKPRGESKYIASASYRFTGNTDAYEVIWKR